jgi:hypothetical protein
MCGLFFLLPIYVKDPLKEAVLEHHMKRLTAFVISPLRKHDYLWVFDIIPADQIPQWETRFKQHGEFYHYPAVRIFAEYKSHAFSKSQFCEEEYG